MARYSHPCRGIALVLLIVLRSRCTCFGGRPTPDLGPTCPSLSSQRIAISSLLAPSSPGILCAFRHPRNGPPHPFPRRSPLPSCHILVGTWLFLDPRRSYPTEALGSASHRRLDWLGGARAMRCHGRVLGAPRAASGRGRRRGGAPVRAAAGTDAEAARRGEPGRKWSAARASRKRSGNDAWRGRSGNGSGLLTCNGTMV